jgi:hypothetical protein
MKRCLLAAPFGLALPTLNRTYGATISVGATMARVSA